MPSKQWHTDSTSDSTAYGLIRCAKQNTTAQSRCCKKVCRRSAVQAEAIIRGKLGGRRNLSWSSCTMEDELQPKSKVSGTASYASDQAAPPILLLINCSCLLRAAAGDVAFRCFLLGWPRLEKHVRMHICCYTHIRIHIRIYTHTHRQIHMYVHTPHTFGQCMYIA